VKRLLIAIPSIILLAVVALFVYVAFIFDPNDYRDLITSEFKQATGRDLEISGDLSATFFPVLGFETGAITIANAPGFGDKPMASIQGSQVSLNVMPLLRGEIEMDTLTLKGVQANLVTLKDGRTNWEDLAGSGDKTDKPATEEKSATGGKALAGLAIGGVELSDAEITWDDRKGGTKAEITKLNLSTGAIAFEEKIPVKFTTDFALNGDEMAGNVTANTNLTLTRDLQTITLQGLVTTLKAAGTALEGGNLSSNIGADLVIDQKAQTVSSNKLALSLDLDSRLVPVQPMRVTLNSPLAIDLARTVIDLPQMEYSRRHRQPQAVELRPADADRGREHRDEVTRRHAMGRGQRRRGGSAGTGQLSGACPRRRRQARIQRGRGHDHRHADLGRRRRRRGADPGRHRAQPRHRRQAGHRHVHAEDADRA